MLWAGRLFNGSRVVDFSNSGGSGHSSVPIPLSIRVSLVRYGGRRKVESGSRGTAYGRRGKDMGRMPMLRFGNWRGCGAPFGEIGPEKRLNQVEITEVQKGLHFLHQPGTWPQSE